MTLLTRWKKVDDTMDRLDCGVRVERGECEMAGFCNVQCRLYRFEVTHLTDQHDVGVLAKSRTQRRCEAGCVTMHLEVDPEIRTGC